MDTQGWSIAGIAALNLNPSCREQETVHDPRHPEEDEKRSSDLECISEHQPSGEDDRPHRRLAEPYCPPSDETADPIVG